MTMLFSFNRNRVACRYINTLNWKVEHTKEEKNARANSYNG